ncbi:MAG: DUF547 domain-containing protein [Coxiellaceae bacterium]|nr:DUF547 domain-containing protein [Coxiellaceae bacterium]
MKRILASIVLTVLLLASTLSTAAPKKKLWPRWQVNNPLSTKTNNYTFWDYFLKKYVHPNADGINLVAYGQVSDQDKESLHRFLREMSQIHIDTYNRKAQEAYWINIYNALTVDLILRHYPVKSIMDIKISGLFSPGPWGAKLIKVEEIPLSLNDIENRILRPIWNDQRIHYAINCAALSCPNLQRTAFTANNVDSLLNMATRQYVNSPRGTDIQNGQLILSTMYIWYKSDFGGNDDDIIDWLEIYANPVLQNRLKFIRKISKTQYNWGLNIWKGTLPIQKQTTQKIKNKKIRHRR